MIDNCFSLHNNNLMMLISRLNCGAAGLTAAVTCIFHSHSTDKVLQNLSRSRLNWGVVCLTPVVIEIEASWFTCLVFIGEQVSFNRVWSNKVQFYFLNSSLLCNVSIEQTQNVTFPLTWHVIYDSSISDTCSITPILRKILRITLHNSSAIMDT